MVSKIKCPVPWPCVASETTSAPIRINPKKAISATKRSNVVREFASVRILGRITFVVSFDNQLKLHWNHEFSQMFDGELTPTALYIGGYDECSATSPGV